MEEQERERGEGHGLWVESRPVRPVGQEHLQTFRRLCVKRESVKVTKQSFLPQNKILATSGLLEK